MPDKTCGQVELWVKLRYVPFEQEVEIQASDRFHELD
jgi:hypothetical protein